MEKIYRLAPCCPAIVIGKPECYQHLSARIRDLVGPTSPLLGNQSQIRYKFRGAHRIFNIIHGTDDPAAAIREALVFFEFNEIKQALESVTTLVEQETLSNLPFSSTEDLTPAQKVDLNFPQAKFNLKSLLQKRSDMEISSVKSSLVSENAIEKVKLIDYLHSLVVRFYDLLQHEQALLHAHHQPREERKLLLNVYYPQLRTCSLARDSISEAIVKFSRDSALHPDVRRNILSRLATVQRCFEVARAMTIDVEFKESLFDTYLSWLASLDIPLDKYDEANLHAAWSVVSTEFADFEIKSPEEPF